MVGHNDSSSGCYEQRPVIRWTLEWRHGGGARFAMIFPQRPVDSVQCCCNADDDRVQTWLASYTTHVCSGLVWSGTAAAPVITLFANLRRRFFVSIILVFVSLVTVRSLYTLHSSVIFITSLHQFLITNPFLSRHRLLDRPTTAFLRQRLSEVQLQ